MPGPADTSDPRLPSGPDAPARLIEAWPASQPLAVLYSGDPDAPASRARWTLIARPSASAPTAPPPGGLLPPLGPDPGPLDAPFSPGWLGYLSYDAGRILEPAARHSGAVDDRAWPLAHWVRIDDALIFDHGRGRWLGMGAWTSLLESRRHGLGPQAGSFALSPLAPTTAREAYLLQVRRVLDYIRAGDAYQVNLAHRLSTTFSGSSRALFLALMASARPWYGGYLEFIDARGHQRALLSASPELFLDFDPATRRILTRPMKGTRRGDTDPAELVASAKDRAELNMIIDLMRNDLGRICEFGSVRVEAPRDLERHGAAAPAGVDGGAVSILQTTASISGTVRAGLGAADILAATFPGGSVTGAPKIRAMQIIDELEVARRGPYCGCFGFLADSGRLALNIAIRTALITQPGPPAGRSSSSGHAFANAVLDYSVGAGIVADSDPEREWQETLDKAAVLSALVNTGPAREPTTPCPDCGYNLHSLIGPRGATCPECGRRFTRRQILAYDPDMPPVAPLKFVLLTPLVMVVAAVAVRLSIAVHSPQPWWLATTFAMWAGFLWALVFTGRVSYGAFRRHGLGFAVVIGLPVAALAAVLIVLISAALLVPLAVPLLE